MMVEKRSQLSQNHPTDFQGSRNDFVKYVDFGHDTPVHVSVYGADFMKSNIKAPSVVMRK